MLFYLTVLPGLFLASCLFAFGEKAETISFRVGDEGEEKSLDHWGVDATWLNMHNARFTERNAGDLVDYVRIGFFLHEPYEDDGDLSDGQIEKIDASLEFVDLIKRRLPVKLSPNNLHKISNWYKEPDGGANVDRWYHVMEKTREYVEKKKHEVVLLEPFNEPDWKKWNMGQADDLDKILKKCKDWDVPRCGPSTLSTTPVKKWYGEIRRNVEYGGTHTLGGTMREYIDFIKRVHRDRRKFVNPEAHSLVEAIVGIEHGIESVCWWDQVNVERAAFMRACLGKRLAYVAVEENWSAACVYRDPKGLLHGFASTNERSNGVTTSYHFVCEDKDVTYYIDGERKNGVFRKRGEPFELVALKKDDRGNDKSEITKWVTIRPKR